MRLGGGGVLISVDGVSVGGGIGAVGVNVFRRWRRGVDSGDDGKVVLKLVEVLGSAGECVVKRVQERRVMWAERELGDEMGEVECCKIVLVEAIVPSRFVKNNGSTDGEATR